MELIFHLFYHPKSHKKNKKIAKNKLLAMVAIKHLHVFGAQTIKLADNQIIQEVIVWLIINVIAEHINTAKDVWEIPNVLGVQKEIVAKINQPQHAIKQLLVVQIATWRLIVNNVMDNGDVHGVFKITQVVVKQLVNVLETIK
jgi:hypothetical protein